MDVLDTLCKSVCVDIRYVFSTACSYQSEVLCLLTTGNSLTGNVMSESSDVIITPPVFYPDLGAFLSSSVNSAARR